MDKAARKHEWLVTWEDEDGNVRLSSHPATQDEARAMLGVIPGGQVWKAVPTEEEA